MRAEAARSSLRKTAEFLRRVEHRLERNVNHPLLPEFRIVADRREFIAQLMNDRLRRAGRRHDTEVQPREIVAIAEFGQRRNVRQQRRALFAVDSKGGHRAVAYKLQPIGEAEKGHRRRSAHHVVDRFCTTLERHLDDVGPGRFCPFVHEGDQRDRRRGVAERAGLRLRQRRKLGERVHIQGGIRHHDLSRKEWIGDRREILVGIVGDLFKQELVIRQRLSGQDADRVAVVRRLGAGPAADIHGAAGAVLHDDRLAQALAHLFTQHAHENIAGAARAGCRQCADWAGWIVFGERRRRGTDSGHGKPCAEPAETAR